MNKMIEITDLPEARDDKIDEALASVRQALEDAEVSPAACKHSIAVGYDTPDQVPYVHATLQRALIRALGRIGHHGLALMDLSEWGCGPLTNSEAPGSPRPGAFYTLSLCLVEDYYEATGNGTSTRAALDYAVQRVNEINAEEPDPSKVVPMSKRAGTFAD